jgi:hypothetical protein
MKVTAYNHAEQKAWPSHGNLCQHKLALEHCNLKLIHHPPYSYDLTPSDYHLFTYLKNYLLSQHIKNNKKLMDSVKTLLSSWVADLGIQKLNPWLMMSFGNSHHVALLRTDILEEHITSIFRVMRLLNLPAVKTSQKTKFFDLTYYLLVLQVPQLSVTPRRSGLNM